MAAWTDGYWQAGNDLRLHYRDYPGRGDRPPILCIPGLTRNARDFEGVAARLAGDWRVLCLDLRGRGDSAYAKDPMSYVPLTYVGDVAALIDALDLKRFVLFGTSLGGLITMLLSTSQKGRLKGALLNDVGPELDGRGLERIRGYVGRSQSWPTWLHAARYFSEVQGEVYPDWTLDQWLIHAKRLCRLSGAGRIVFDYDMKIAEPFRAPDGPIGVDLWPALMGLKGIPSLIVRGERSDLFTAETAEKMTARLPEMESVTVPRVGHAPTLEEPEAVAGIDRLLERVLKSL
ncbi:alpha/beta fold hydrolase [Allosphingosinicella vermicomposti]|uniref:alpha/beta fold hydrolase n=1 Tax=Allosphingosinicella vermicomposti TaxID=614671 RepID=UPI000D0EAAAC|nr:alpha/beta hydrolase [Allosphingosinicella vermicomposti]